MPTFELSASAIFSSMSIFQMSCGCGGALNRPTTTSNSCDDKQSLLKQPR